MTRVITLDFGIVIKPNCRKSVKGKKKKNNNKNIVIEERNSDRFIFKMEL
jgi:hypothetical protein